MSDAQCDILAIFTEAVRYVSPAERSRYLDEACRSDPAARQRVDTLLRAHFDAGNFLGGATPSPTLDSLSSEKPGTQIGRYRLLEQIGEGGMGAVYMAEQTEPVQRRVALKIVKPGMDTREVVARFEAERQALAMMDHPNIAKVLDGGATESGRPFFVMELVPGLPITEYCDQANLTTRERLALFALVCQAVQHAHQKGIIHRDVKPSNVLVTLHDGVPVPKVIDFGVAKAVHQPLTEATLFTGHGRMIGTPMYMSPEQAEMTGLDIDTRSDIYSLGVLLYEMLTGSTPFDQQRLIEAGFDEMRRVIREEDPPRPSHRLSTLDAAAISTITAHRGVDARRLGRQLSGDLDWIVMKALQKDRTRRYESASGLAADIQRYLGDEPVEAGPPSAVYALKKFARRNKAGLALATVVGFALLLVVGAVAGSVGWVARGQEARQARVSERVELILDEVGRFEQEQKWSEALLAARRAEAALAGGEAPKDLSERVRQEVADLEMVERLEQICLVRADAHDDPSAFGGSNQRYSAELCKNGVAVDLLPADEAAAWFRSRARVLPALICALDDWARCRARLNDESGGKSLTVLAETLDTDPWRRRLRQALIAKTDQALEELAASAEVAHQSPRTVEPLARALTASGRPQRALDVLGPALQRHPDDFWLHFTAGVANNKLLPPRDDEAARHDTAAVALRPRCADAHYNLGYTLGSSGNLDGAIACFRQAIALEPKKAIAYFNLGLGLHKQGKVDEAIPCYRQAIALDPKDAGALSNLGVALKSQGKVNESIACYRQAIAVDPKNDTFHNNLAVALKGQGKLVEALAAYRRAGEVAPVGSAVATQIPEKIRELERQIAVVGRLPAVLKGDDQPKDAAEGLAFAGLCYQQGRHAAAARLWAKALAADPKLADDRKAQHRYNAVCAAALAGCGKGRDEPVPDNAAGALLRRQARDWLQAELAAWSKLCETADLQQRSAIAQTLRHWQVDTDLAGIRDPEQLAKLPKDEQQTLTQLWKDVETLRTRAEPPASPTKPPTTKEKTEKAK